MAEQENGPGRQAGSRQVVAGRTVTKRQVRRCRCIYNGGRTSNLIKRIKRKKRNPPRWQDPEHPETEE